MAKVTYAKKVEDKLLSLEVNEKFEVNEFLTDNWGDWNYFIRRSFDVYVCKAKKNIQKAFPKREFKCIDGHLVRLK